MNIFPLLFLTKLKHHSSFQVYAFVCFTLTLPLAFNFQLFGTGFQESFINFLGWFGSAKWWGIFSGKVREY